MKIIFAFVCSVLIVFQTLDLDVVRGNYKEATQSAITIDNFFNELSSVTKNDRVELVGYKGASLALKAKNEKTIKDKKNMFVEGVGLVEYAINKDSTNVEVRFIRLSIQQNTPKILKYKMNIANDKAFILKQFQFIKSPTLKTYIKDYILYSKGFSEEEKALILAE